MKDGFVFYRSFWECISKLDAQTQADVMRALCEYALDGEEPRADGITAAIFSLMKPQVDANNRKYENGKKGGRPKTETEEEETKQNQTITKQNQTEPNPENEEPKEKEKEKDKVKDKEKEKGKGKDIINPLRTSAQGATASQMIIDHGFSKPVQTAVLDWVRYKTEKRQGYKETGLKSLLTVVQRQIDLYGEEPVIRCIEDSMASGWQGIAWGKLEGKPKEKKDRYAEIREWFTEDTG